jgi:hypothetical protein
MIPDETILVADQYSCWHTDSRHHFGADPQRDAQDLRLTPYFCAKLAGDQMPPSLRLGHKSGGACRPSQAAIHGGKIPCSAS